MARHSSLLAWEIPWTEEPGGLQSVMRQRVGHNWAHMHTHSLESQGCLDLALLPATLPGRTDSSSSCGRAQVGLEPLGGFQSHKPPAPAD